MLWKIIIFSLYHVSLGNKTWWFSKIWILTAQFKVCTYINSLQYARPVVSIDLSAWDIQQCGMRDQQSLRSACAYAQSDQSLCLSLEYSMTVKLLTEHHLEFLSLKGGCTGSPGSTLVKMSNCWKSHVAAHLSVYGTRRNVWQANWTDSHSDYSAHMRVVKKSIHGCDW